MKEMLYEVQCSYNISFILLRFVCFFSFSPPTVEMTELFVSLAMCAWFAGSPQMNPGKDKVLDFKLTN